MADALTTMLDVTKMNSSDSAIGLIEEVATTAPEFSTVSARSISGTTYKTLHRTALPGTSFRNANAGIAGTKSTYDLRIVSCYILGGRVVVDRAIADADEEGPEHLQALEAAGIFESALITFGNQFYYGDVETSGFPGLQSLVDSSMVYNAGGTNAATASSVYGVRYGEQNLQAVVGQNGQLGLSDFRVESVADDDSNYFPAYVADMTAWVGLQATNKYCVGRIRDITADSGKTLTDDVIAEFLSLWPASRMPDALYMNRRSLKQLQQSRTATNTSGAPAPFPTESFGFPIVVTDSLVNTEALS